MKRGLETRRWADRDSAMLCAAATFFEIVTVTVLEWKTE
jgi:hypothetical protein